MRNKGSYNHLQTIFINLCSQFLNIPSFNRDNELEHFDLCVNLANIILRVHCTNNYLSTSYLARNQFMCRYVVALQIHLCCQDTFPWPSINVLEHTSEEVSLIRYFFCIFFYAKPCSVIRVVIVSSIIKASFIAFFGGGEAIESPPQLWQADFVARYHWENFIRSSKEISTDFIYSQTSFLSK